MDSTEADGLYGDVDALIKSYSEGKEQEAYQIKDQKAQAWLVQRSALTTDAEPQDPAELPLLEDEFQTEGDVWEDY